MITKKKKKPDYCKRTGKKELKMILMKTLLGGYLTAAAEEDDLLHLTIHESYEEDALQMEIWLNEADVPVQGEIVYDGRRILTMKFENFLIL